MPRAKKSDAPPFVLRRGHVLVLRTCAADLSSYNGFVWPESGKVEAPDWNPRAECGHGLHGLLWGIGDASLLDWSESAKWLVVEAASASLVDLSGKVKFSKGRVVYCGERGGAIEMLVTHGADPSKVVAGTATAGDYGTATAGTYGTATAGYSGTATAGDFGTATAGDSGTATAGDYGTATAGNYGTATAGDSGTATAGDSGTATAGVRGTLILRSWDEKAQRRRYHTAYVGEDGLLPDVPYRLDEQGKFVRADGGVS